MREPKGDVVDSSHVMCEAKLAIFSVREEGMRVFALAHILHRLCMFPADAARAVARNDCMYVNYDRTHHLMKCLMMKWPGPSPRTHAFARAWRAPDLDSSRRDPDLHQSGREDHFPGASITRVDT
jgi:hypothetical protein